MIRMTLALTGALAALTFASATAQADPDAPTPIGGLSGLYADGYTWWLNDQLIGHQDFSVLNAPEETFEGLEHYDDAGIGSGINNYNVVVEQDISGNVPIGEQYNYFNFFGDWGEVYNSIGGTPEAFFITPFGDLDLPTSFVEAVGPTFFEPWSSLAL